MSFLFKLTLLFIVTVSTTAAIAAAGQSKSPETTLEPEKLIGGDDIDDIDDNDDDGAEEYTKPENSFESNYQRGRMSFLFGNYDFAFTILEPLAKKGYAKAQATLGWMYHTGKGVKKNLKKAMNWYSRAAKQQHVIAQNNLGVFYEQGLGGANKNSELAAKWYREAADVGYAFAQYNLGILYYQGKGVERDIDEAIFWLQIAALQGVEQAKSELERIDKHLFKKHKLPKKRVKKPQWKKDKTKKTHKQKKP